MFLAVSLLLLCTANFVSAEFQCKRIAGSLRQIDAGAGKVIGVNKDGDIFQWVNSKWMNIPGKMKHVSAGRAGVLGVNRANEVYELHGHTWVRIPDIECSIIPGKLKQIDAGAGEVYGVNDADDIFHWVNKGWKHISGKLIHVSYGPAGLWGVNRANNIFKFQDNEWMAVSGLLKQVDAGGDKFLGGVNAQDNIFCLRQSCTVSRSSAVSFTPLDGSLKYYSCGPMGCWGVNSGNNIFFRHNVNPAVCQGDRWEHVSGSLVMIEVGTDGSVYGVNSAGNVFRRDGITARTPIGTTWTQMDFCATFKHVTYDNGYLWLIGPTGDIYRCAVNK